MLLKENYIIFLQFTQNKYFSYHPAKIILRHWRLLTSEMITWNSSLSTYQYQIINSHRLALCLLTNFLDTSSNKAYGPSGEMKGFLRRLVVMVEFLWGSGCIHFGKQLYNKKIIIILYKIKDIKYEPITYKVEYSHVIF